MDKMNNKIIKCTIHQKQCIKGTVKNNIDICAESTQRGTQGIPGEAATITVGTTITGEPGTNASVVNSGTTSAAILDFTIPRGDKGETGEDGFSPIANVTQSGNVTTITITDKNGTTSESIDLSECGQVDDVLVNGNSVVENKIAEISVPTNNNQLTNGAGYQTASDVNTAIAAHNVDAEAHADIRAEISALNDFTASTIVPTTTNFVPSTTYTIDEALQRTANLFGGIQGEINDINGLIPNQATTSNQLADKAFVNSTVATNAANFRGNWAIWADVPTSVNDYPADYTGSKTPTNNDYMTVTDASGYNVENIGTWRFIYVGDWATNGKNGWHPQYQIGTAFTAAQQAAIDSGITSNMVDNYINPTSTASTAYNTRITALETDKVDKIYTGSKVYGTNSLGSQIGYQAGSNIEFNSNGLINVIGVQQQLFVMPEATAELLGSIVQYMGTDTADYTHGVMYQCVPVYGDYTITTVGINNVTLDRETFEQSFLYDPNILSYTFECTRGGLRQTWLLPNGQSWTGNLMQFGIEYMGRPTVGATITLTRAVAGYTWGAYAGVSSGNDKINIVGDKIYGVNVVGQYSERTMPMATAELAGKIIQYNGVQSLLSMYQDGHFYRCEEDRHMRNYTLEAEPMKYSELVITDWLTLEDFMQSYDSPVSFIWQGEGRGWVEEESMSMLGTDDLTQYGIAYTLNSGETLEAGDKITINFTSSYFWKLINVQDGIETVQFLPDPSLEYLEKVVLYNGWDGSLPEPDALYVQGKLYKCVEVYNEQTGDWGYEWQALPYQFSLLQYNILPSDISKVYTNQCIQYVGASQVWDKYAENIYLENGHIYRATIVDEDYPDFASVRYVDVHPYQMMYMPDPIEAYNGVVTQYVGTTTSDYTNGHFYKCVPTGEMTGPSSKYRIDGNFTVTINAETLATKTSDPDQTQVFEFRSQAEGADWVLKVSDTTWTTVNIADYGITVTGSVPYGTGLKVKYQEPQPEYEWEEVPIAGNIQVLILQTPIEEDLGKIVQYVGDNTQDYTNGYFYKAVENEATPSELTYNLAGPTLTVELDIDTFEEYVQPTGDTVLIFQYNTGSSVWLLQSGDLPVVVDLADYGVTITGTPNENSLLQLFYTAAEIEYIWEQTDVQPSGGGSQPTYDSNNERMVF